jgi:hypothetical protein
MGNLMTAAKRAAGGGLKNGSQVAAVVRQVPIRIRDCRTARTLRYLRQSEKRHSAATAANYRKKSRWHGKENQLLIAFDKAQFDKLQYRNDNRGSVT